jgi:hypothetical protein
MRTRNIAGLALMITLIAAAAANADVTWTSAQRYTHAGTLHYPRMPPGPPFFGINVRHELFGEGPFDTGPGTFFSAAQTSLIDYAGNSITGSGRASWQMRQPGLNFNTYGFAHSHIHAEFTIDEPTPYHSVFNVNAPGDYGPRESTLSSGATLIDLTGGTHEGMLQPGFWAYDSFIGPSAADVMADPKRWGAGNTMTFDVSFHIPEPTGSLSTLAASFVLLRRRRAEGAST